MRSGRLLGILVYHNPSAAKAGIIVSKKLSAKATERNRLKRRLRAAIASVLPGLSGLHIVVLPTRRAMSASVAEFEEELRLLLQS